MVEPGTDFDPYHSALTHQPAADEELNEANTISNGGCISDKWADYPYAFGICLASLFFVFVLQLVLFRLGTEKLEKLGFSDKPHGHPGIHGHLSGTPAREAAFVDASTPNPADGAAHGHAHTGTGSDMRKAESGSLASTEDGIAFRDASEESPALAQLLGVATLEFGVIFHRSVKLEAGGEGEAGEDTGLGEVAMSQSISSLYVEMVSLPHSIIIGLTLAVTGEDEFNVLFIVIIVSCSVGLLVRHDLT